MKRLSLIMVALGAVCAVAYAIDIPRIGFARDAQGNVTAVNGLAGNFIAGDTLTGGAAAFSWNGAYGICKKDASLEWWDGSGTLLAAIDAPAGDVVIGFGAAGQPQDAWIYSKSAQVLFAVKVNQWRLQQVPVRLSGTEEEVLAMVGGRDSVDIALRRGGELFVATFDIASGGRTAEVALGRDGSSLLFLAGGALAGIDGSTLWLRRADGSEWSVDTGGAALSGLSWMGREWVQVSASDGGQLALRIRAGASEPALYVLPSQPAVNE